ncbi:hypothetical protein cand_030590 [Cryptosporidium andersoni]|uniref:Rab-GAP TBC domain-containing protein n=1 Tax=Cryptosporidium andersoni TaxID=117008 RepID=A0A1J4MRW9_9CRYT|nr:hypothetical protein cand_030590 [Cryptosporidium andersoni]
MGCGDLSNIKSDKNESKCNDEIAQNFGTNLQTTIEYLKNLAYSKSGFYNNENRRYLWILALDIDLEHMYDDYFLERLVENADRRLYSQIECDISRCLHKGEDLRSNLKNILLAIYSLHKHEFSYIQGIHDIGSVFVSVYLEDYEILRNENILGKFEQLENIDNKVYTQIKEKLSTKKGRINICFTLLEKFLLWYSNMFSCNTGQSTEDNLDNVLSAIGMDLLSLINEQDTELSTFMEKLIITQDSISSIFMFCLPWLISWFSHNIPTSDKSIIFRLFDLFLTNPPIFLLHIISQLVIYNKEDLFKYISNEVEVQDLIQNCNYDMYPFFHFYFQSLDLQSQPWEILISRAKKSFDNHNSRFYNSAKFWRCPKYIQTSYIKNTLYGKIMNIYKFVLKISITNNKDIFLWTILGIFISYITFVLYNYRT